MNKINKKTEIVLKYIVDLLRKSKKPLTCKEITQMLRPEIKIAYRDMHRYINLIRKNIKAEKIGHSLFYSLDKDKLVKIRIKIIKDYNF